MTSRTIDRDLAPSGTPAGLPWSEPDDYDLRGRVARPEAPAPPARAARSEQSPNAGRAAAKAGRAAAKAGRAAASSGQGKPGSAALWATGKKPAANIKPASGTKAASGHRSTSKRSASARTPVPAPRSAPTLTVVRGRNSTAADARVEDRPSPPARAARRPGAAAANPRAGGPVRTTGSARVDIADRSGTPAPRPARERGERRADRVDVPFAPVVHGGVVRRRLPLTRREAGPTRNSRRSARRRTTRRTIAAARAMSHRRLGGVAFLVLVAFGGLFVKLALLQAVSPEKYVAEGQRIEKRTVLAPRGSILDRNGHPFATTVNRPTIWTDPSQVTRPEAAAAALAPVLGLPEADLLATFTSGREHAYLARQTDEAVGDEVRKLDFEGVYVRMEPTRYQPAAVGTSVIGEANTDNVGMSGLERSFDTVLAGLPGLIVQEESVAGDTIPSGRQRTIEPQPGSDVVTTIDRDLQFQVEAALVDGVRTAGGRKGAAVVLEPASGQILAMANAERSTDDDGVEDVRPSYSNMAVTEAYELGSVLKPVTMATGIETLGLRPETVLSVPPRLDFYDSTFSDEGRYETEDMALADILRVSSNVGTISVAAKSGEDALAEYLRRFHFGRKTGVGLPYEADGLLPAREEWWGTSLPTLAIGQSLTVTPLQLAAAYAAIANGGEWVTPSIVKATVDPTGRYQGLSAAARERIIEPETAAMLRSMLQGVVEGGTGKKAAVPGYDVAGKTGTAWKASDGNYGLAGGRSYVASFAGMVPADDPRLVIVVVIDEPGAQLYTGGGAAAPTFQAIAQPALRSLEVAPARYLPPDPDAELPPTGRVRARAAIADPTVSLSSDGDTRIVITAGGPVAVPASTRIVNGPSEIAPDSAPTAAQPSAAAGAAGAPGITPTTATATPAATPPNVAAAAPADSAAAGAPGSGAGATATATVAPDAGPGPAESQPGSAPAAPPPSTVASPPPAQGAEAGVPPDPEPTGG